jgi:hypothetical protein
MRSRFVINAQLFICFLSGLQALLGQGPLSASVPTSPKALKTLTIPVYVGGFSQAPVTVSQGDYYFVILNHSGRRDLHFTIDRLPDAVGAATSTLSSGQARLNNARFEQALHVGPGTYHITVVERPKWLCTIKVQ